MTLLKNLTPLHRTRVLEDEIDTFLEKLAQSALTFRLAVRVYLREQACPEFEELLRQVSRLESEADRLRRSIESQLYSYTLIPDSRGDVLGLLENLDAVHNKLEGVLWSFSIETPDIPESVLADFHDLTEMTIEAAQAIVQAARAFFRNVEAVGDHLHKVMFFEREADKISTKLKRGIFAADLDLSRKTHLRDFAEHIDDVADFCEDVADRLAIYTIKRRV